MEQLLVTPENQFVFYLSLWKRCDVCQPHRPSLTNRDKSTVDLPMLNRDAAPLAAVGAFQLVVWLLDPLRVHADLADGKPMTLRAKISAAAVNGGIWLGLAYAMTGPVKRPRAAAILVPFAVYFTAAQWVFWWWPYLLGPRAGLTAMIDEHKRQLEQQPRILPAIGDNLVPDIEHTVLQPLSIYATLRAVDLFLNLPLSKADKKTFVITSIILCNLPMLFVLKSETPFREFGAILCSGQVITSLAAVYSKFR